MKETYSFIMQVNILVNFDFVFLSPSFPSPSFSPTFLPFIYFPSAFSLFPPLHIYDIYDT